MVFSTGVAHKRESILSTSKSQRKPTPIHVVAYPEQGLEKIEEFCSELV